MAYEDEVDPNRITNRMRDELEALSSAADMIDVLVSEAERHVRQLEKLYEHFTVPYDDWRIIRTFLRLANAQAEIVKETSDRFRKQRIEVA